MQLLSKAALKAAVEFLRVKYLQGLWDAEIHAARL